MVAGQHKLSRRALLAGVCAVPAVPLFAEAAPPRDPGHEVRSAAWAKALARLRRAEAEISALAHSDDQDAYDEAVGRQNVALGRLLKAPAPDLAAIGLKVDLIAAEQAWELTFGNAAFTALREDVRRLS
ncbi:MAG TPA: hypothetical protein VIA98_12220 [Allosphingosinicella sp.]|jgi:hypothetical protein